MSRRMTVWLARSVREEAPTIAITGRTLSSSRRTRSEGAIDSGLIGGSRRRDPLRIRGVPRPLRSVCHLGELALGGVGHPLEPSFGTMVHDLRLSVVSYEAPCPPARAERSCEMSKRVLTLLVLMALAATPAFAYVQPGTFVGSDKSMGLLPPSPISLNDVSDPPGVTGIIAPSESPVMDGASAPVPEPGT